MSETQRTDPAERRQQSRVLERRHQVIGLLLLALAAIVFAILRTGPHRVFPHGWWHLW